MKAARIAVLVVAVAAGGVAAFLAGSGGDPPPPPPPKPVTQIDTVEILVARSDINMGQVVSAQEIQWQIWPTSAASPSFLRRTDRPDAIQQLTGSIARGPFVSGEPIRETKLIKANGSGGFILPNDHVDVILTRRDRETERASGIESHTSETILTDVRVLAIDQTVEEKGGQRVVVG